MNGKNLFHGMSYIDESLIDEAESKMLSHATKRKGLIILIAAILSMLGIAAFAATMPSTTGAWFSSFFGYSTQQEAEMELTANQSAILDAALVEINQRVTQSGYTITLESGLCDGYRALIKARVDAPAGVSLNGINYALSSIKYLDSVSGKFSSASYTGYPLEDKDPNDNSITMLLDIIVHPAQGSMLSLADGSQWRLSFGGIEELTCSGDDYAWNILCDGTWEFQLAFDNNLLVTDSAELLSEPVKCLWSVYIRNWEVPLRAKIISFELRSLTATIRYKRPFITFNHGVYFNKPIYLVLQDGTKVRAEIKLAAYYEEYDETLCQFDRPVSAEDVAYIEFPGIGQVAVLDESVP